MIAPIMDEVQFSQAKARLSEIMDDVVHRDHPKAVRRERGKNEVMYLLPREVIEAVVGNARVTVDYLPDEEGVGLWANDLEIGAHGTDVAEARRNINADTLKLRGRYHLEWGGQFENYQRARSRLLLVIPLAVVLIMGLLYLTYQNVLDALRVFTGAPLAVMDGVAADGSRASAAGVAALLFRNLATLRTDIALFDDIETLRCAAR